MTTDKEIFLMANLGSEISRLLRARQEKNVERVQGAYARACDILRDIEEGGTSGKKELDTLKTILDSALNLNSALSVRSESLQKYFLPFATTALRA